MTLLKKYKSIRKGGMHLKKAVCIIMGLVVLISMATAVFAACPNCGSINMNYYCTGPSDFTVRKEHFVDVGGSYATCEYIGEYRQSIARCPLCGYWYRPGGKHYHSEEHTVCGTKSFCDLPTW